MMRCLLALCVIAAPASAQEVFSNDYGLLFHRFAAQVERRVAPDGKTIEELQLPGPVVVQRRLGDSGPVYRSADESGAGAVGCMLGILMQFNRAVQACPAGATDSQKAILVQALIRVGTFYAQNRVPQVEVGEMISAIAKHSETGGSCAQLETPDVRGMFDAMLDADLSVALDEMLETPRLPVVNPCL